MLDSYLLGSNSMLSILHLRRIIDIVCIAMVLVLLKVCLMVFLKILNFFF